MQYRYFNNADESRISKEVNHKEKYLSAIVSNRDTTSLLLYRRHTVISIFYLYG